MNPRALNSRRGIYSELYTRKSDNTENYRKSYPRKSDNTEEYGELYTKKVITQRITENDTPEKVTARKNPDNYTLKK